MWCALLRVLYCSVMQKSELVDVDGGADPTLWDLQQALTTLKVMNVPEEAVLKIWYDSDSTRHLAANGPAYRIRATWEDS